MFKRSPALHVFYNISSNLQVTRSLAQILKFSLLSSKAYRMLWPAVNLREGLSNSQLITSITFFFGHLIDVFFSLHRPYQLHLTLTRILFPVNWFFSELSVNPLMLRTIFEVTIKGTRLRQDVFALRYRPLVGLSLSNLADLQA